LEVSENDRSGEVAFVAEAEGEVARAGGVGEGAGLAVEAQLAGS
jgi:hypothetical protein